MSMIRDPRLAAALTDEELAWLKFICPVTEHYGRAVRALDLQGLTLACWQHVLPDTVLSLMPFVEAGARVRLGACSPDSTDDRVAAWLAKNGVEVFAKSGMTDAEYRANLAEMASGPVDIICDMGGELIEAIANEGHTVLGALEATTTGVHRIKDRALPFPTFNWNDIVLKDALHNRYHVGDTVWPVFSALTNMSLYGRSILIIGFGPVGRGMAERARAIGGVVSVVERDPVRRLEAQHFGCRPVTLEDGLASNSIIVTATGIPGILTGEKLSLVRDGAILVNVGHGNREIDVNWLERHPKTVMKRHVERFDISGKRLYLLNRGSLLNLAAGSGRYGSDCFDPYNAVMLSGLSWIGQGGAASHEPGFHPFPRELELEIAELTAQSRG
ncbi:MAG: adenosylhomocysteinase [Sphingomonadales bacterium]